MSAKRLSASHRSAFITGASSGLGRVFAESLLAEGLQVWGSSRSLERLACFEGKSGFYGLTLDLADADAALSAFDQARREAGGAFDVVILCAGFGQFAPFDALPAEAWTAQLEQMLLCQTRLSHAAYAGMHRAGRGTLVQVSSMAVEFPLPYMSGYNMVKAATSALSQSLLFEARGTDVRILDFRPGDYRTAFNVAMQPAQVPTEARIASAWRRLEENLQASPEPSRAGRDLLRALRHGKRGIVRSGDFFQTRLAPFLARFAPDFILRAAIARYFKAG